VNTGDCIGLAMGIMGIMHCVNFELHFSSYSCRCKIVAILCEAGKHCACGLSELVGGERQDLFTVIGEVYTDGERCLAQTERAVGHWG